MSGLMTPISMRVMAVTSIPMRPRMDTTYWIGDVPYVGGKQVLTIDKNTGKLDAASQSVLELCMSGWTAGTPDVTTAVQTAVNALNLTAAAQTAAIDTVNSLNLGTAATNAGSAAGASAVPSAVAALNLTAAATSAGAAAANAAVTALNLTAAATTAGTAAANAALVNVDPTKAVYLPSVDEITSLTPVQLSTLINTRLASAVTQSKKCIAPFGITYICGSVGTKNFLTSAGTTQSKNYCIHIPDGCDVDFRGAIFKPVSGHDSVLISNFATASQTDNIKLRNLIVDGVNYTGSSVPLVWLHGLLNQSEVQSIQVKNSQVSALQITGTLGGKYSDFNITSSVNIGLTIGGSTATYQCLSMDLMMISAFNVNGQAISVGIKDSKIGSIFQRNCLNGVRLLSNTDSVSISQIKISGKTLTGETAYTSQTSGLRVQGDDTSNLVKNITINLLDVQEQNGSGLYITNAQDINISTYKGTRNGRVGSDDDIVVTGLADNITFGQINIRDAGSSGIQIASVVTSNGGEYKVDSITIENVGLVGGSIKAGIVIAGGRGRIDKASIIDRQTTVTSLRGIYCFSPLANTNCEVDFMRVIGVSTEPLDLRSNAVLVNRFRNNDNPIMGVFTPAALANTTVVTACARKSTVTGGFVEPIVRISPVNAAARLLGILGYNNVNANSGTITFSHGIAVGTEVYKFEVGAYQFAASAIT